jgi:thioredoxin reductase
MKTNIDDIYAAGDIVEFPLFTAEDQQVNVQHWQMANAHGKGLNIKQAFQQNVKGSIQGISSSNLV